jgi:hypothetical protein
MIRRGLPNAVEDCLDDNCVLETEPYTQTERCETWDRISPACDRKRGSCLRGLLGRVVGGDIRVIPLRGRRTALPPALSNFPASPGTMARCRRRSSPPGWGWQAQELEGAASTGRTGRITRTFVRPAWPWSACRTTVPTTAGCWRKICGVTRYPVESAATRSPSPCLRARANRSTPPWANSDGRRSPFLRPRSLQTTTSTTEWRIV